MCAVDYAEPNTLWFDKHVVARKSHTCWECSRAIQPGESYWWTKSLFDGHWSTTQTCRHCEVAGAWMRIVCGGYCVGGLEEELREHWLEGYSSILMGRLILGIRDRWHGGADPVPDAERIRTVAHWSMDRQVAS